MTKQLLRLILSRISMRSASFCCLLTLISLPLIIASYTVEMCRAIEEQQAFLAHTILSILYPVAWVLPPVSRFLALPAGGKPLTHWTDQDEAWLNIGQGISNAVKVEDRHVQM